MKKNSNQVQRLSSESKGHREARLQLVSKDNLLRSNHNVAQKTKDFTLHRLRANLLGDSPCWLHETGGGAQELSLAMNLTK